MSLKQIARQFRRRPITWAGCVAGILLLLESGCAWRQDETIRSNSFHPYVGLHVGEIDLRTFLCARVALLATCNQNPTNKWTETSVWFPSDCNLGCAVMIDTRGYFLTAAHCLKYKSVFLVFRDSPQILGLPARVVWQGNRKAGQPDIAIIRVERMLKHAFEWADEIHIDQPVMAVGLAWTNKPYRIPRGFELMAGRILETNELKMAESDFSVASDLPLQPGDSGGPLVNGEGRLIGINVEGTPPQVHWVLPKQIFPTMAQHPNQNWLREVIEADAKKHPLKVVGWSER